MNNLEELRNLGIIIKRGGSNKTTCPKCSHNRKNKKDPCLSVDIENGLYHCHHCGWNGNVKFKKKKEYLIPSKINTNLNERIVSWFNNRGISESTLLHFKIGESIEYIPQLKVKRRVINYNFIT